MPIIDTLTKSAFIDGFKRYGRGDQFTYDGLCALYDYLEMLSDDIGEPIEYDPIGLCCEYAEYSYFKEVQQDYDIDSFEDLQNTTTVICLDGESEHNGFIIQQF